MEEGEMGFPGASGAVTKDGAGEAGRGKSSGGGRGTHSTLRRTLRCFVALPGRGRRNIKAVRSWKVPGISSEGKEPRGVAFAGLSANFFPHRRGPRGNAAPGDGSIGNQASLAPLLTERLSLHTDLLLRVPARLPASTGIANNLVSPTLRGMSLPSITPTRGRTTCRYDRKQHRKQRQGLRTTPQRGGGQQHPSYTGGEEQKRVAGVRGRARLR